MILLLLISISVTAWSAWMTAYSRLLFLLYPVVACLPHNPIRKGLFMLLKMIFSIM